MNLNDAEPNQGLSLKCTCPTRGMSYAVADNCPLHGLESSAYRSLSRPEPQPESVWDSPAIWPLVIADMQERDQVGRAKYGVPLQAHNGRNALIDAYQEALDLVVYLRQAIYESEGR